MAISSLAPRVKTGRDDVSDFSSKTNANLKLVVSASDAEKVDRKSFIIFLSSVAVIGLLLLLAINTMLAQDAFELSRLQTQATALNDQREAVMKKIATASSPGQLALRAKAQGMVSSQNPRFLTLDSNQANYTSAWQTRAK
jgi:hypothetical protein